MLKDTVGLHNFFGGGLRIETNKGKKHVNQMYNQKSITSVQRTTGGLSSIRNEQPNTLNRFMIHNFVRGIFLKHLYLFFPDDQDMVIDLKKKDGLALNFDKSKTAYFFETILRRAKSTTLQFKKVCCIMIKFLECCKNETNYMKYLKYDLHKLIVAAFVLSVPNVTGDDANKILNREISYNLYSKVTGLSVDEVTNCCSIVRPILIRRSRKQYNSLRPATGNINLSDTNNTNTNINGVLGVNILEDTNGHHVNDFLNSSRGHIDIHSANYNLTNSHTSDNDEYHHHFVPPHAVMGDIRYTSSSSTSIPDSNNNTNSTAFYGINDTISNSNGTNRKVYPSSNGYILRSEIEQFDQMGKKLVLESFRVV